MTTRTTGAPAVPPQVLAEIDHEQQHVDRVYAELVKAGERAALVEAEGLARGRTDRTGEAREEEITGLFERDVLVFAAGKRRRTLETQYEGLVFGRLDLEHDVPDPEGNTREIRYVGRLGVRDDDYEPLVIDWRAPAASPFYRATPADPQGVLRRRVLRCRGAQVLGVEDDLMVPEAPEDLVVVGDGALMAALTRTRGERMRDIVATIQQHQDQAIRATARGVTEITGGPGTGKTVVALHRAAYLLYSDRRRYESGGILVVGPSAAYTAYIERVLPSLGEDTVTLRSLGDLVEGITATRLDSPEAARLKGSLRIRRVLSRAARDVAPDAPTRLRTMIAGHPVHLDQAALQRIRGQVLRHHQHNLATEAATDALAEAAWHQVRSHVGTMEKPDFLDRFRGDREVEAFVAEWWRPIDPREVLLWLSDRERLGRYVRGILSAEEAEALAASYDLALEVGTWSVADAALVDDLSARLGVVPDAPREERGFYEIDELENVSQFGVAEVEVAGSRTQSSDVQYRVTPQDMRDRLLDGRIDRWGEYAHVLVDEAQDLSPMQWRAVGRRGRYASWTVVGDAAQSSWPDADEARQAREEAFGSKERRGFRMTTNYRNAREIFDYAADVIRREVPDADIPDAVRETGVDPRIVQTGPAEVVRTVSSAVTELLDEVDGLIAVVAPERWRASLAAVTEAFDERVLLIDPMSTKGLEYDATVIVDPAEITAESPGGIRVTYVALTRAAHRMTVVEVTS
ncbi:AAA family ATPase [Calidifontibacter sp. DB0510]|uniref:AAA family ATPase n=1 Tax=Metallococcus carri TaxID=1656884 RepID=A0A967AZU9_9MICO|nr:AAA family ATPase [Metallococcus carri]NHN55462.1 AAA family ATPase [Metallococcus carri]NOP38354.1 AAA family ATPase [Calidifontibacter sp. DB2511S]